MTSQHEGCLKCRGIRIRQDGENRNLESYHIQGCRCDCHE